MSLAESPGAGRPSGRQKCRRLKYDFCAISGPKGEHQFRTHNSCPQPGEHQVTSTSSQTVRKRTLENGTVINRLELFAAGPRSISQCVPAAITHISNARLGPAALWVAQLCRPTALKTSSIIFGLGTFSGNFSFRLKLLRRMFWLQTFRVTDS